jgi:hypothetical protein
MREAATGITVILAHAVDGGQGRAELADRESGAKIDELVKSRFE